MAPQEVQFSPTKLIDEAFVGCVADLLEQAIARLNTLLIGKQDAIVTLTLAQLEDDWQ